MRTEHPSNVDQLLPVHSMCYSPHHRLGGRTCSLISDNPLLQPLRSNPQVITLPSAHFGKSKLQVLLKVLYLLQYLLVIACTKLLLFLLDSFLFINVSVMKSLWIVPHPYVSNNLCSFSHVQFIEDFSQLVPHSSRTNCTV